MLSLTLMLVDTGASTSVIPRSHVSGSLNFSRHHLVGAGGAQISCYGSRIISLQFQRRRFTWDFEVADIKMPILGAYFLTANGLVVDLQRGCITSNEDQNLVLPCSLHVFSSNSEFSINRIHCLLEEEFRDMAGYEPFQNPPPASRVYHSVDTADATPLHYGETIIGRKVSHCQGRFRQNGGGGCHPPF